MKPVKAYIGFSRGSSLISRMIRWLDGGYYNHVYWRFDFEPSGALIYESHMSGGIQITPYEALLSAKLERDGVRKVEAVEEFDLDLTPQQCEFLYNDCIPYHGKPYSKLQIAKYYWWIRFNKRKAEDYINKISNRFTCNTFLISSGRQVVELLKDKDFSYTIEPLYILFSGHPSKGDEE